MGGGRGRGGGAGGLGLGFLEVGGEAWAEFLYVVRGADCDSVAVEVLHCVGGEFFVEHAEDGGGDVVDCYLSMGEMLALRLRCL